MSVLETLTPANNGEIAIYTPYYPRTKHNSLPLAITLYQKGSLEGGRQIEGGDKIPFVATWYISKLPSELTRCRLQFDGQADLSYEVTMSNSEFVDYLIDVIVQFNRSQLTDFPRAFYQKLLRFE
jgi:hypothetical protein